MNWQKMVEKRWWWLVAGCILTGTLLHMVGYNYGLPYLEEGDEGRLFTNAFAARRGEEFGLGVDLPGYPPLIFAVHHLLQPIAENITGRPALRDVWVTINLIRMLLVLLNGATGALLAWTAYHFSGRVAALLIVCAWFLIPVVLRTTVVALTEGFQIFFYVLAFALAVFTLERRSQWAAILAVSAGLAAMLAKYSALPALGFGVGAVLWLIWQDNRWRWGRILLIQAVMIGIAALVLLPFVRSLSTSSHPEATSFATGQNFARYLDFAIHWQTESEVAALIGLAPLVVIGLLVGGSLLLIQRGWRGAAWGFLLIVVHSHLVLIAGYILFQSILFRYIAPILGLLLLLVVLAVCEMGVWLARRSGKVWLQWVLPLMFGVVWLVPVVPAMLSLVYERTLPDTRAAMGEWSLNVLTTEYNLILADSVASGRVFARDFGGYRGLWQYYFFEQDFGSRSLDAWLDDDYQYAIGTPEFFADAFARQPDTEAQILLLKQFPPPNSTQAWRGQPLMFYRLWRMQHETQYHLGDDIVLVGYDLEQTADALIITPYWQAAKLPARNYNVYIHLAPPDSREIMAQADGIPAFNRLTQTWYDPGETLIGTTFTVPVPADASGDYRLLLGLYDFATGARLPSASGEDFVELAHLTLD